MTKATNQTDRRHQDNLTADQRSMIGSKGGLAVSQNRHHMSEIGRKGGKNSHRSK